MLICKLCKFGKYICYNVRDIKFFLGGYFFGVPCRSADEGPHIQLSPSPPFYLPFLKTSYRRSGELAYTGPGAMQRSSEFEIRYVSR